MSRFGRRTTAMDVARQIDLRGKIAVITGATSGIGGEIARAMAAAGAELILPARNIEAASAIADNLITDTGNAKIRNYKLDLADFESVRRLADNLLKDYPRIDILINGAGIIAAPFQRCHQGYELHFSVNHLGHFLLTSALSSALLSSPAPRVVSLSAAAHGLSPLVFDDIHFNHRRYDQWQAYGQSKTANILFAKALNRRLATQGGTALAVNPGFIISKVEQDQALNQTDMPGRSKALKSPAHGAACCVWAATTANPQLAGNYCEDFRLAEVAKLGDFSSGLHPHAADPAAAERLWELSEQLVDCQFALPQFKQAAVGRL